MLSRIAEIFLLSTFLMPLIQFTKVLSKIVTILQTLLLVQVFLLLKTKLSMDAHRWCVLFAKQ